MKHPRQYTVLPRLLLAAALLLPGCTALRKRADSAQTRPAARVVTPQVRSFLPETFGKPLPKGSEDWVSDEKTPDPTLVSYNVRDREKLGQWALACGLTLKDWGAVGPGRRAAVIIGSRDVQQARHQPLLKYEGFADGSSPGIFFVKSQTGKGSALAKLLRNLHLHHADWVAEGGEGIDMEGGDELPDRLLQRLFLVRVPRDETAFWKNLLKGEPLVSSVQDMVITPFIGIIYINAAPSERAFTKLEKLMNEHGCYFGDEPGYWLVRNLERIKDPSEITQIWVPPGDELLIVNELKAIGIEASLAGLLDGVDVKTVTLTDQRGAGGTVRAPLTHPQVMERLLSALQKHGPPGLEITRLGESGLWGKAVHQQPWALAGGDDVNWEKDDIKVNASIPDATRVEIQLILRTWSTGKGFGTRKPADTNFEASEDRSTSLLKLEQDFNKKLIEKLSDSLLQP